MAVRDQTDVARADHAWTEVRTSESIEAMPWEPFGNVWGVRQRILWRAGDSYAGLLRLEPGAAVAGHEHRRAHHHALVLDGECTMLGAPVTEGAYVHVPAGVRHAIEHVGPTGCTLFYLYLREPGGQS